jgi:PAS domain S-box-containing protein
MEARVPPTYPAPEEQPVDAGQLRLNLERNLAESALLVTLSVAGLFAFFGLLGFFVPARQNARLVAIVDVLTAAFLFGFALYLRRRGLPPRWAHPALALVSGVVLVDFVTNLVLTGNPEHTVYLMLFAVGTGSILLSVPWLALVLLASLAAWGVVAAQDPGPQWQVFGFGLLASSALAVVVQAVRRGQSVRLEMLHLRDDRRKQELELRQVALEGAIQAAWESEERYRQLVEAAPDAIMVLSDGKWVYLNAATVKLFGAKQPEDLLGRSALEFVHPDDRAFVARRTRLIQEGKPVERAEIKALRVDGSIIHLEVTGIPILYNGRPADQTIVRDVTERRVAEEERRVADSRLAEIGRLKEMDRVKTRFINTLSHELRTPLTPIRIQLHILRNTDALKDGDRHRKATEMLQRNVDRLGGLVDELLEVARVQSGTLRLDLAPVELGAVVSEALESFEDVARNSGVRLERDIEGGLLVEGDARRLGQVLVNLCGNALKFTPSGGSLLVRARRLGDEAVVSVKDTGSGIRPEDIERLFQPFSQVHDNMEKTNAGTGLGLYISRGIVEGHGGHIWAESGGPGKGSTFAFAIPLLGTRPKQPPAQPAAPDGAPTLSPQPPKSNL